MYFQVITLFPDMIRNAMQTSIMGRAVGTGLVDLDTVNLKEFSQNRYGSVDDYPYGGGAGMLIQCEPVWQAYQRAMENIAAHDNKKTADEVQGDNTLIIDDESAAPGSEKQKTRVIYTSPGGKVFNNDLAKELSTADNLVFLCGHYEGIDERILREIVTDEISIGDYVLTGGELPALVMMDAVSRFVPGVLHNDVSAETESFGNGLLEYPQYTRPSEWKGKKVPDIILSGDHKKVDLWRMQQSIHRTAERRPDLYAEWLRNRGIY